MIYPESKDRPDCLFVNKAAYDYGYKCLHFLFYSFYRIFTHIFIKPPKKVFKNILPFRGIIIIKYL